MDLTTTTPTMDVRLRHAAEYMAVRSGMLLICEYHPDSAAYRAYEGSYLYTDAYMMANSYITSWHTDHLPKLKFLDGIIRRQLTDAIKDLIDDAPEFCEDCICEGIFKY